MFNVPSVVQLCRLKGTGRAGILAEEMSESLNIIQAEAPEHFRMIRELLREYAGSLSLDLCFQNFEEELAGLPGQYAPPTGRLLLGLCQLEAAGCAALRKLGDGICEMKRLYVPARFRGRGAGRQLAEAVIKSATDIGYERMRLDTLAEMKPAIALYQALGFYRIPSYYPNPSPQAVYFELRLMS